MGSKIRGFITLIQFAITVAFVILFMYMFKKRRAYVRKVWFALQIKLLGIKIVEIGKPDISCDMVILNHQSLLDIIVLEHLNPRDVAWVAKKEIADMFFYGHILKAPEMIMIDRQNKAGLIKLIKDVKDRLSYDRPIAIFPEGTRSDGTKMLKFKTGAKLVAEKYKLKVQPVILINTRKIIDSKTLEANPGEVKVIYLDPVEAKKGTDWFDKLEKDMNEVFEKYKNED